jgi:alpha-L-fucosidase
MALIVAVQVVHAAADDLKATAEQLQWFRDARFGMFIHWGPVSQTGKELSWSRKGPRPQDVEHEGEIPADEYDQLYRTFNPERFDAREWVRIAQSAGMKYLVFTSKHHDGFSNFDTAQSDYSIAHTPFRRDIGLRFGIYYSQRDWYHPDYLTERHARYVDFMHGQLRELLTHYGKVDILWFDSIAGSLDQWRCEEMIRMARSLQPGILINNRAAAVLGGYDQAPKHLQCDFGTPEQRIGEFTHDRPWESCITLVGHQWSWKPGGEMMSIQDCIGALVRAAGGDGNLLLNVGPMPTGEIEPRQSDRLREMGEWLASYGQSINGTRGGPLKPDAWGACTHRGDDVYLHVLHPEGSTITVPSLEGEVTFQQCLTGEKVRVHPQAGGVQIELLEGPWNPVDTIIHLNVGRAATGETQELSEK